MKDLNIQNNTQYKLNLKYKSEFTNSLDKTIEVTVNQNKKGRKSYTGVIQSATLDFFVIKVITKNGASFVMTFSYKDILCEKVCYKYCNA